MGACVCGGGGCLRKIGAERRYQLLFSDNKYISQPENVYASSDKQEWLTTKSAFKNEKFEEPSSLPWFSNICPCKCTPKTIKFAKNLTLTGNLEHQTLLHFSWTSDFNPGSASLFVNKRAINRIPHILSHMFNGLFL